MFKSTTLKA